MKTLEVLKKKVAVMPTKALKQVQGGGGTYYFNGQMYKNGMPAE